jgi:hypothetical protein
LIFAKEEFSAVMGPAPSDAYMLKLSKGWRIMTKFGINVMAVEQPNY